MTARELGNQPAYPTPQSGDVTQYTPLPSFGMTKRQEFAKAAMTAFITISVQNPQDLAKRSLKMADALLAALAAEPDAPVVTAAGGQQ